MGKIKSKILITGSTGFLGTRLVASLLKGGENDLRCFCRPGSNTKRLHELRREFPLAKLEIFLGDLKNLKDARVAVRGVETIYNLATLKSGPFPSVIHNSVLPARNLLDSVCKEEGIRRVVHVSSFSVYGVADMPKGSIVDENTQIEPNLNKRNDSYAYAKVKQEELIRKYIDENNLPIVIVRPGVVYGPGGDEISRRVGFNMFGYFLNVGRGNLLPVSYIDNCVDSIILAGSVPDIDGEVFNVHDSDLCTCNEFLKAYIEKVRRIKSINVPYLVFWVFSYLVDKYYVLSKGQIPPVLSTYKTASLWKGNKFDNSKIIERLGWYQKVSTQEGLDKHFKYLRTIAESDGRTD